MHAGLSGQISGIRQEKPDPAKCIPVGDEKERLEAEFHEACEAKVMVAVSEAGVEASYQLFTNFITVGFYSLTGFFWI